VTPSYPPIGDYAIIGDCRSAALVSRGGSIDWLCLPRFDSPSVFAALLDSAKGGRFRIAPTGSPTVDRRYLGRTNVLETTFTTTSGIVRLTDLLPVADEAVKARTLWPEHEVLRCVEVVAGEVEVQVEFEPRLDYARAATRIRHHPHESLLCEHGTAALIVRSEIPLQIAADGRSASGRRVLRARDRAVVGLSFTRGSPAVLPPTGDRAWELVDGSVAWWEDWASQCQYDWSYRNEVIRSALTLKLLTYAPSGAVIAAPTTSLPEEIGGVRNWDYRYCWLRDAALTLRALLDLGYSVEAESFLSWLVHATRLTAPRLQILYDVYGEARIVERSLDHLAGYRSSKPVRIGNDAANQFQLDVYGEVLDAVHQFVVRGGQLDRTTKRVLVNLGRTVCDLWKLPDDGIWEPRRGRRQNTHSKVMCWVALDRLVKLQEEGHVGGPRELFARVRDEIGARVEKEGWSQETGSYVAFFGGNDVDASLLRLGLCDYVDARDRRMVATTERIRERLGVDGLLYRYLTADGIPGGEGAFGICSFWGVECYARQGRQAEAVAWFESLLAYANDVGLFSEELDPRTRSLLGNFPQAFTHIGLINAALTLAECAGHPQGPHPAPKKKV
jgi:GH15 family glucan-1,4-alpha-glucosidase